MQRFGVTTPFIAIILLAACTRHSGPPLSPEDALKTFQIEKGFRIELFASEPFISDPVAMEFDENGRIYVVEMHGYPLDIGPSGSVKLLEDRDGDGRPDKSTVFADRLVMPTGVMRWKKGVLVTAAPDILYLEDTNGDGKADVRKVILTGFPFSNPQHTVNSPIYGLDNWIYLAYEGPSRGVIFPEFSDPGQPLRFPDRPNIPGVDVGDRAVRFRPGTHEVEALSGDTQFGHAFDEWGHYFTLDNSNHGRHEVIAARYLKRNPNLLVTTSMQNISDHGNNAKVYPISRNPRIEMLTEFGEFTSACGMALYLGGAFPSAFHRVSFVNEPVHNLVHRDVLSEAGTSFVASRAAESVEFLASTDSWFRPVNLTVGPDGALYLLDYYREIIEHPEWTSTNVQTSQNLYNGSDKGRIYRIVPDSSSSLPLPKGVRLGAASEAELVQQLGNPNVWWRRTAQRLLADRQSPDAVQMLVKLFEESPSPLARLHALWTLEGFQHVEAPHLEKALLDSEAGVRENAIRVAELHLTKVPALAEKLLKMGNDPSPKVRFQLLCTLGFVDSPASRKLQEKLLFENLEDEWMQLAALSASSDRSAQFFKLATTRRSNLTSTETKGRRSFFRRVCSVIGARQNPVEIQSALETIADNTAVQSEWWRTASLEGLAEGARGKPTESLAFKRNQDLLLTTFNSSSPSLRRSVLSLVQVTGLIQSASLRTALQRAEGAATDPKADPEVRSDAIGLLCLWQPESRLAFFQRLVDPREPESVQRAAVKALGPISGEEIGKFLISRWRVFSPDVRSEAADSLLMDPGRLNLVLSALKSEEIQGWTLNFSQKRKLLMNRDPAIRNAARAILDENPGERETVLKRYQAALQMDGDSTRGQTVFKKVCAKCHKFEGAGAEVGPDLGTVRNRPASVILADILAPSRSIAPKYEAYVAERVAGGISEGVIGAQTPTSITLRQEEGKELMIPRSDIRRLYVANLSAMPSDLEKQIDVQQMADLLRYITRGK
jgi:putative membrane-bound dehydrogenase-like protein